MLCVGALALPSTAQAGLLKAIWGPTELAAGNAACPTATQPCSPFPVYRELGVDVYQFQIHWDEVAPTRPAHPRDPADPAYQWGAIDKVVQEAAEYGIGLAALIQRAPGWANGGRAAIWAPSSPRTFADFAFAASRRYPSIRRWMIWGEPSRRENFRPMDPKKPTGVRIYAGILDASYAALKQASPSNIVIGGMTLNGGTVMPPQFVEWMKLKNGQPPRMDLWGDNPFDARFPRLADQALGQFRGFNDIDTLYAEITEAYRAGHRKVPRLWLSEWTIVSDRPLQLFSGFFVSRREQAIRLKAAYQIAGRTSYVAGLGWFSLLDQAASEGEAAWGLLQADGKPKPAFQAYKSVP
jgi:polysaccharide biosynthesis protein PslG